MADSDKAKSKPRQPAAAKREKSDAPQQPANNLVMVGIGASAGGLNALKALIGSLSLNGRISYVVAQHVSPRHTSLMVELLAPRTNLTVVELNEAAAPAADTIYVIPPNHDADIKDGQLIPLDSEGEAGPRPSIDRLFMAIAREFGEHSAGIVLSGTGRDGTHGLRAIKEANGVALVQDPASAEYNGMPNSAIQAGLADLILTPERIGEALQQTVCKIGKLRDNLPKNSNEVPDSVNQIYNTVKAQTNLDLRHYKGSTVLRRINRRALLAGCESLEAYAKHLDRTPQEANLLAADLSVCVTEFFRDAEAFRSLRNVIHDILSAAQPREVIRIWVPGCATGEEAYSIAMIADDVRRKERIATDVLIFVSDINPESVAYARRGVYPEAAVAHTPKDYVEAYFERSKGEVVVSQNLRQNMVFATQNVTTDPPFSKLDLISCRNLLIYLETATQKQVLGAFHYALKPEGYLFLGKSESVDVHRELFIDHDKRARVYRRTDHPVVLPAAALSGRKVTMAKTGPGAEPSGIHRSAPQRGIAERTRDMVAAVYAPPAVIVDTNDRILHFMGELSPFITLPRGPADWHVHELVIPPLSTEIRPLIHRCRREKHTVRGGNYTLEVNGQMRRVTPVAHADTNSEDTLILLAFEIRPIMEPRADEDGNSVSVERVIREMESELASTREHLQTVVEEVETSNEELQTLNEELQSSNEELQSTNEELQTSNEELQSTNEELLTVNEELATKTAELELSRTDLFNIKESLDYPLIVVNDQLAITHYNPMAELVILQADRIQIGDVLTHVPWRFATPGLGDDTRKVLQTGEAYEQTLRGNDGQWLRLRILPYRSTSGELRGAVLTFHDVTKDEQARVAYAEREAMHRIMLESSSVGMVVTDIEGVLTECNPVLSELLGLSTPKMLNQNLSSLIHKEDQKIWIDGYRALRNGRRDSLHSELRLQHANGSWLWCSLHTAPIRGTDGVLERAVSQIQDISNRRRKQEKLVREHTQLRLLNEVSRHVLDASSLAALRERVLADLGVLYDDARVSYLTVSGSNELTVLSSVQPDQWPSTSGNHTKLRGDSIYLRKLRSGQEIQTGQIRECTELRALLGQLEASGTQALLDVPLLNDNQLIGVLRLETADQREWSHFDVETLQAIADLLTVAARDLEAMDARRKALEIVETQRERIAVTLRSIGDGVITTDTDGRIDYMNPAASEITGWNEDEANGRSLFHVYRAVQAEGLQPVHNPVERCLQDGQPVEQHEMDLLLLTKDTRRVPISHSAAPLKDAEGKLIGAVLIFRDVSQTRMFTEELSRRATHDPLTNLTNRTEFERRLEVMSRKAQRGQGVHSVLFVDLDRFKAVNDTAGHSAGDALLREIGQVMRDCLRQTDTLSRIGGDEFAVLLQDCATARALEIAEQLRDAVRSYRLDWQGRSFSVGASIGIVEVGPEPASITDILANADSACYAAKRRGRNAVCVYDRKLDDGTPTERSELLARIGRAVEEDLFSLSVLTARPAAAKDASYHELLLRMPSDNEQLLEAHRFLPVAERYGMLGGIDRWVIRTAISHLDDAADRYRGVFAINLSGAGLADVRLHDYVHRKIEEGKLDPKRLCFEISESSAVAYRDDVLSFIERIGALGCQFTLDDFGGGIGSFGLLRELPMSYVKIGNSFRSALRSQSIDQTLITAICDICHEADRQVIASRVEEQEDADQLLKLGVDFVQGHINHPPTPLVGFNPDEMPTGKA